MAARIVCKCALRSNQGGLNCERITGMRLRFLPRRTQGTQRFLALCKLLCPLCPLWFHPGRGRSAFLFNINRRALIDELTEDKGIPVGHANAAMAFVPADLVGSGCSVHADAR